METPSRVSRWLEEMSQLRKKVSSLKVMLQKMNLEREPTLEQEEEDIESFLRRMAADVRLANSKAGIKPTAPLSVFDKENSIEFLLGSLHYLYNYYMVCALLSHAYHVTYHVTSCAVTSCHVTVTV